MNTIHEAWDRAARTAGLDTAALADCLAAFVGHTILAGSGYSGFAAAWRDGQTDTLVADGLAELEKALGAPLGPDARVATLTGFLATHRVPDPDDFARYIRELCPPGDDGGGDAGPHPAEGKLVKFFLGKTKSFRVGEVLAVGADGVAEVRDDTGEVHRVEAARLVEHKGKAMRDEGPPPAEPPADAAVVALALPATVYDQLGALYSRPEGPPTLRHKGQVPPAGAALPGRTYRVAARPDRVFEYALVSGGEGAPTAIHVAVRDEAGRVLATLEPSFEPLAERPVVVLNREHYRLVVARGGG